MIFRCSICTPTCLALNFTMKAILKYIKTTMLVLLALFIALVLVAAVWIYILTVRGNSEFKAKSDKALASIVLPNGAELLKDEFSPQGFFDLDNGPHRSVTYKIDGYNREELGKFFGSNSPVQEIKFYKNDLRVNVYLSSSPDWSQELEVGRDIFREQIKLQSVNEFTIIFYVSGV